MRRWGENLRGLNGKPVVVTIGRLGKQRSLPQNSYYWGVVVKILADYCGYTQDEMHEALKWLFLRVHRDNLPDTVKSTATLNTMEFIEYVENIKTWACTDLNVLIPEPDVINN